MGLGGSSVALALAAALTWIAAARLAPRPGEAATQGLGAWWRSSPLASRVLLGAVAGAWLAWTVWLLRYPALGIDSVAYHLPVVVGWVQGGHPGLIESFLPGYVGNYPLTNELVLSWGMGLAHSFVPASLWSPAMLALLLTAGWAALRRLDVPAPVAVLSLAAVALSPMLTHYQQNGAYTDLPALAWLVACGLLCLEARTRPLLLCAAVLAAALAVGSKTTTAPLALVLLGTALLPQRRRLRPVAAPLLAAGAVALAVGGYWYLRNLVLHGSPLWPFVTAPWGDPVPAVIDGLNDAFIEKPRATIDALGDRYLELFAGGLALLGGALLAPLVARSRAVIAAAATTLVSLLIWARAPFTGVTEGLGSIVTISTLRYLLPTLAVAALTLALAAREGRAGRTWAYVVLGAAVVLGAVQTFDLGFPSVPSPSTPLAGALLGGALVLALTFARLPAPALRHPVLLGLPVVAAAALLAIPASGYVSRHAQTSTLFGSDTIRFLAAEAPFGGDGRPMVMAPVVLGVVAGDRLQHRVSPLDEGAGCRPARAAIREGWLVVLQQAEGQLGPGSASRCLSGTRPAFEGRGFHVYGG